ncbi:MAG: WXG100 family type VII secretion target, partial [Actinomycetota bacterium]|nr:WXG100 family type VII secretion target [Actinomycetota bacterium]
MAVSKMNNAVAAGGDGDGEAWDVIGSPLDEGVDRKIPAYADVFQLALRPQPGEKRREICEVRWGKIDKDAARLNGLAGAMEEIVRVVRGGKDRLAHDWKGESFEAFKLAIDTVEKTLTDHANAARATATGLTDAMSATRTLYTSYRDKSTGILSFQGIPRPDEFVKIDDAKCAELDWAFIPDRVGPARDKIRGLAITKSREQWFWHENGLFDVSDDAQTIRDESTRIKSSLEGKINEWYVATDGVRTGVTDLYEAALENLRLMAELKVFSTMQVPGATPPADDGGGGGQDDNGGGGGGSSDRGGGGGPQMPPPPPMPEMPAAVPPGTPGTPEMPPAPAPGLEGTQPTPGTDSAPETVTIEDGDNKISVQSPDGQGNVKITIDDGTGQPKSYNLDFGAGTDPLGAGANPPGAASEKDADGKTRDEFDPAGPSAPGTAVDPDAETVRAGQDGKCVISEPPLTITAERPAGQQDTVLVTVDDGSGTPPKTYTLDYSEPSTGQPGHTGDPVQTGQPAQTKEDPSLGGPRPGGAEAPQQLATEPVSADA